MIVSSSVREGVSKSLRLLIRFSLGTLYINEYNYLTIFFILAFFLFKPFIAVITTHIYCFDSRCAVLNILSYSYCLSHNFLRAKWWIGSETFPSYLFLFNQFRTTLRKWGNCLFYGVSKMEDGLWMCNSLYEFLECNNKSVILI